MDYGVPSDYSGENDQSTSVPESDQLQCTSKQIELPNWLLISATIIGIVSAFCMCLFCSDEPTDSYKKIRIEHFGKKHIERIEKKHIEKSDSTVALYVPEVSFHKQPLPK